MNWGALAVASFLAIPVTMWIAYWRFSVTLSAEAAASMASSLEHDDELTRRSRTA